MACRGRRPAVGGHCNAVAGAPRLLEQFYAVAIHSASKSLSRCVGDWSLTGRSSGSFQYVPSDDCECRLGHALRWAGAELGRTARVQNRREVGERA